MKKIFTFLFLFFMVCVIYAQTPKSQRLCLMEEFTQASCGPCASQNPALNTLLASNTTKVVSLKYQTAWPGVDIMNTQTATDVAARVTYYAVSGVPNIDFDGNVTGLQNVTPGSVQSTLQTSINTEYAVASPFTIALSHTMSASYDSIFITCNLTATTAANYTGLLILHVALAETEIDFCKAPGSNGETAFYNVMRKMVPSASGTALSLSWTLNQTDNHSFAVKVPSYIYNVNNLAVVAFIQDNSNKNVKQAAYSAPLTPIIPLDASIDQCSVTGFPTGLLCTTSLTPGFTFKNTGSVAITSATIQYKPDVASSWLSYSWNGSLAVNATAIVALPSMTVTPGTHTFYVSVTNPNGSPDYNIGYNQATMTYSIGSLTGSGTFPLTEGIESSTFPPTDWINLDCSGDGKKWTRVSSSTLHYGGFGNSNSSAYINFYNIAAHVMDDLIIKSIDLSGGQIANLTFDVAYAMYDATSIDTLAVKASTDCGATWSNVYQKYGTTLCTRTTFDDSSFVPLHHQWRTESVNISSFTGNSSVYLKFHAGSGYGNNCFIDNINITFVTSVDQVAQTNENIEIYPNPSNGQITVSGLKNSDISIYNLLGNKVMEVNNASDSKQLDLSKFDNGAYIVQIISDKKVTTKKLILDK